MTRLFKVMVITVALAGSTVGLANATSGPGMFASRSPLGTGSSTASIAGSTGANLPSTVFGVTNATISCSHPHVTVTNTSTVDVTADLTFGPHGKCVFSISGTPLGTATVTTSTSYTYTLQHGLVVTPPGALSRITVDLPEIVVSAPSIGCTITVPAQSNKGGGSSLTLQNVSTSGANDTSASPWGSKVSASSLTLTYTTDGACPGLAEHGSDFSINSSVYVKNLWGSF
jgi:hypothetical protein